MQRTQDSMETCAQHENQIKCVNQLVTDVAIVRRDLEHIMGRICQHIEEAERSGGWRDRMTAVEQAVCQLQNDRIMQRWFMIGSGVISGLIVAGGMELTAKMLDMLK
jgi:hypothetical protein